MIYRIFLLHRWALPSSKENEVSSSLFLKKIINLDFRTMVCALRAASQITRGLGRGKRYALKYMGEILSTALPLQAPPGRFGKNTVDLLKNTEADGIWPLFPGE